MFKESAVLTFYAETPVHMGAGTSVSYVDLPVQREKHTDFPILAGSGIKGVLKELAERVWNNKGMVETIFGKDTDADFASCVSFTDARILFFPVRSISGVFAWVTCPFVLERLKNDAGISFNSELKKLEEEKVIVSNTSVLKAQDTQVVLEEFAFDIENGQRAVDNIAEEVRKYLPDDHFIDSLPSRIAIVDNDTFTYFVKYAVEIRTRIRINQKTGTVEESALFSEELIPSESIFYSLVFLADPYNTSDNGVKDVDAVALTLDDLFKKNSLIQLGGDETTGKGFMRVKFALKGNKGNKNG